eukprot:COSAG02_NODE_7606_length_2936_cov_5.615791_6_plen_195_part_01
MYSSIGVGPGIDCAGSESNRTHALHINAELFQNGTNHTVCFHSSSSVPRPQLRAYCAASSPPVPVPATPSGRAVQYWCAFDRLLASAAMTFSIINVVRFGCNGRQSPPAPVGAWTRTPHCRTAPPDRGGGGGGGAGAGGGGVGGGAGGGGGGGAGGGGRGGARGGAGGGGGGARGVERWEERARWWRNGRARSCS